MLTAQHQQYQPADINFADASCKFTAQPFLNFRGNFRLYLPRIRAAPRAGAQLASRDHQESHVCLHVAVALADTYSNLDEAELQLGCGIAAHCAEVETGEAAQ